MDKYSFEYSADTNSDTVFFPDDEKEGTDLLISQELLSGITLSFRMSIKWIEIPPPERKSIFLYWACYNHY